MLNYKDTDKTIAIIEKSDYRRHANDISHGDLEKAESYTTHKEHTQALYLRGNRLNKRERGDQKRQNYTRR